MSDSDDEQGGIAITADEFSREVEALKLLRRRSMSAGGPGNLLIDPDIPPLSASPGPSPTQVSFGENSLEGSSQLFWGSSEVSPSFSYGERILPEALVERKPSLNWSSGGLGRKKSMLSRQYKPEINDGVGDDEQAANKTSLERSQSTRDYNKDRSSQAELQPLDEEVEDVAEHSTSRKSLLRRSISMDSAAASLASQLSSLDNEADSGGVTISPRSKRISRSSKLRKNSLPVHTLSSHNELASADGTESNQIQGNDRSSITTVESLYLETPAEAPSPASTQFSADRPGSTFSESSILDAYSRSRESASSNKAASDIRPATPEEMLTPKQSTIFQFNPPNSRMFTANFKPVQLSDADDQFDAIHTSQPHTAQSPDASFESAKTSETYESIPSRSSFDTTASIHTEPPPSVPTGLAPSISYSQLLKSLPETSTPDFPLKSSTPSLSNVSPVYTPISGSLSDTPSPAQSTSSLIAPSESLSISSDLSNKHEVKEKKSGWSWKLGRQSKKDKAKEDAEAQDKARLKQMKADQDNVTKEKSKDKEKSILSTLFSGGRKKVSSALTDAGRSTSAIAATPGGQSKAGNFGNFMYRYPINVERAVYRLSHIKLANPRRALYEQVLISNLMFWYLSVINKAQMTANQPALIQQAKQNAPMNIPNSVSTLGFRDAAIPTVASEGLSRLPTDGADNNPLPPRPPSLKGTTARSINSGTLRQLENRQTVSNYSHQNMNFYQQQHHTSFIPPNIYATGLEPISGPSLTQSQSMINSNGLTASPGSNSAPEYNAQKKTGQPPGGRRPGRSPEIAVKQPQYDLQSREIESGLTNMRIPDRNSQIQPRPYTPPTANLPTRTSSPVTAPLMAGYTSAPASPASVNRNNIDSFPIFVDGGPSSLGPAGFLQDGSAYPSMQQRIPTNNMPTFNSPQTLPNSSPRSSGIQPGQVFVFPPQQSMQLGGNFQRPPTNPPPMNAPGNLYSNSANASLNSGRRSASSPPPGQAGFAYQPGPPAMNNPVYQPPAPFQFVGQQQKLNQNPQRALSPTNNIPGATDHSAGRQTARSTSQQQQQQQIGVAVGSLSPVVLPPGVGRPQLRGVSNPSMGPAAGRMN